MTEPPPSWSTRWLHRLQQVRGILQKAIPFASGALAAFLVLLLYNILVPAPHQITEREINDTVVQAMASATPQPAFSSLVYQLIRPSLVLIQTDAPDDNDGVADSGVGTGVIIDDRGDILTSLHVVAGARTIRVTFADGTISRADIAAQQPENDIAVIRARQGPKEIVPATLGNPNAMQVGDEAYVVGNPFGLYGSMSTGVISGFNRTFQRPDGRSKLQNLIQIDAAVNPGNSGGPLLNRSGQVVGIITALLNPTEQNVFIGIAFAVPITTAGGAAGLPPY